MRALRRGWLVRFGGLSERELVSMIRRLNRLIARNRRFRRSQRLCELAERAAEDAYAAMDRVGERRRQGRCAAWVLSR
jgi:hypothetical protein